MSNLHDRRFFKTENITKDWQFVAVPNKYRAGQIRASIDVGGYFVSLTSVSPCDSGPGRPPRHQILTFRGNNPQELREKILREFPTAVFTKVDPEPKMDLKAQHAAEMRQQKERLAAIGEQRQFERDVTSEHRKIAASLTRQEQLNAAYANLSSFASDETFGGSSWVEWFRQHVGFFSWPDNAWGNRDTLIEFCESKGQLVPLAGEIADAMLYLLQHKHFYMRPSYKRSEQDEKNAVVPFVREIKLSETISQEQIREAVRCLTAKYGLPLAVSVERLQAVGIPNPEAMFERLQSLYSAEPIAEKSTEELKAGLQAMRNAARGNRARDRKSTLSGY